MLGSENHYFTIDSNIVNSNVNYGIYLSLSNNHNVISKNQVNNNNMGIVLDGQTGSGTDNTISGNTVNGNQNGIFLSHYNGNRITGNSLSSNTNVGAWLLGSSSGNQFTGNYVQESGWLGIYLSNQVNGNVFYNNVFKNGLDLNSDSNYGSDGTVFNNQWNTTPVAGVNIVGGPSIGGNYWSNPSSTGFSSTHLDNNSDGFCDQPYQSQSDLIDNYPLHILTESINTVTNLDETNVLGLPDNAHWDIIKSGTYILTYSPAVINTNNNYAVRIFASDVIFDGNGKTITGPGRGVVESGPSYYGIRVNTGTLTQNVTVKNVVVANKNFGVIYEYVQGGGVTSSTVTSNHFGIYTWKSQSLNLLSNTVYSNTDGIVLDADLSTNDHFTIDSNNIHDNSQAGIRLWWSNNYNIISNNQLNYNNMGIALTGDSNGGVGANNTLLNNTVIGNVNGFYVSKYHNNSMIGNSLSKNTNVAVWLLGASSGNQFTGNYVSDSGWVGIILGESANGNVFYNNAFKNIRNEDLDSTVFNNQWFTAPVTGINIVGGPKIGGNYWSNLSSKGFSDMCQDNNFDGFCDLSYNPPHLSNLIDNYPLKALPSLYASFTGYGLYHWNGSIWSQLNSVIPTNMVVSGTDLYASFTGYGLYKWNGSAWTSLTNLIPTNMVVSGTDLYASFTGYGFYKWNGSAWTSLTNLIPTNMVVSGSDLYASFTGSGLYQWNGSAWSQLTSGIPTNMVVSGSDLYASFTGSGLYKWNGSAWGLPTSLIPINMVASVTNLYASFTGNGLYQWNNSAWSWSQLNGVIPINMVVSGMDLYASFTGYGLYQWSGSAWSQLNGVIPTSMVVSGTDLYASFTGSGLYRWNGSAWSQLNATIPVSMVAP